MSLPPGTRLGPYEILSPLGAGGMGEVYRARDTRLGRDVAVKVLPSSATASEQTRQRFEREARTISQLAHPHICALYDVGREGETEYLVMELLDGQTLADRLARGPLPLDQALRFGVEIADALAKAHRQGIVHRDLKPANVMLTSSGVKLLDFGLARVLELVVARRCDGASHRNAADRSGNRPRHGAVHGARAARGQGRRRAHGRLRPRPRPLRDGDGAESLPGRDAGIAHRIDSPGRSAADLPRTADVPARARPRGRDLPRQGPRGALANGAGRGAAARRHPAGAVGAGGGRGRVPPPSSFFSALLPWLIAAVSVGSRPPSRSRPDHARRRGRRILRAAIPPPPGTTFHVVGANIGGAALSPDGRRLAFGARSPDDPPALWVRDLDGSRRIPRTRRRGRPVPVLVAGQPVDRILRQGKAQDRGSLRFGLRRRANSPTWRNRAAAPGARTERSSTRRTIFPRSFESRRPVGRRPR